MGVHDSMDHRLTQPKPTLLMVSHCVPDALGGADRVRAWQMLRLASRSHQVSLVCLLDQPTNLAQWRAVNSQVRQFAIENHPVRYASRSKSARRKRGKSQHVLAEWVKQWTDDTHGFDAVMCTHPALWRYARLAKTQLRICDTHPLIGDIDVAKSLPKWWRNSQYKRIKQRLRWITSQCDIVTLNRFDTSGLFANALCRTIIMPTAIDPSYFTEVRHSYVTRRYARPGMGVVVHCDWTQPFARSWGVYFQRRIWPKIKRAVPESHLQNTLPGQADPFTALSDASIVIVPDRNPTTAAITTLQAVAMRRAVIGNKESLSRRLPALRHGEQLLLSGDDSEWITHCVDLLRSANTRLRLSSGALEFAGRLSSIEQSGDELLALLTSTETGNAYQPMPRAA